MKRMLLMLAAVVFLTGLAGCGCLPQCPCFPAYWLGSCCDSAQNCASCRQGCNPCGEGPCRCPACCGRFSEAVTPEVVTPGPPSAAITYPYYTNRGPRDFLAEDPPSLGP